MKLLYKKIVAIVLSIFILAFSVILIVSKTKTFSENENRYLESFPKFSFKTLLEGSFIESVEDFFADQFPFRDSFMSVKTSTDKVLGKEDINDVFLADDDYLIEKYKRLVDIQKVTDVLNSFQRKINYVNLNLMLVPTSVVINKKLLPKNAPTYDQVPVIEEIYQNIQFNTIDLLPTLQEYNKRYPMFYRLDHHWTTYGAYYAYVEYCKQNNIVPLSINDFEIEEVTNDFNGTLYSKSNDYSRKPDSIFTFEPMKHNYSVEYVSTKKVTSTLYEKKYLDKKDKYSMFLDNNHPLIVIKNKDLKIESEIVVIKDSYANSFVPFLVNHFKKVHVIDPRFYKLSISDYIKENKNIKDALILYNMNTLDTDLGILSIS